MKITPNWKRREAIIVEYRGKRCVGIRVAVRLVTVLIRGCAEKLERTGTSDIRTGFSNFKMEVRAHLCQLERGCKAAVNQIYSIPGA